MTVSAKQLYDLGGLLLQLNDAFLKFAAYGTRQPETQMDGKNFSKLCKDCGLIDKKFSLTDADLTFSKVVFVT